MRLYSLEVNGEVNRINLVRIIIVQCNRIADCPENAVLEGHKCVCTNGYEKHGNTCVPGRERERISLGKFISFHKNVNNGKT